MERAGTVLVLVWQPVETVARHSAPRSSSLQAGVCYQRRSLCYRFDVPSFLLSSRDVSRANTHTHVVLSDFFERIWNVVPVFCPYFGVQVQVSVFKKEIYDVSQLHLL